jgi:2-aminoadipate transaminase
LISLAAGFTDPDTLPLAEARDLLSEVLASPRVGRSALQYGPTEGLPALRRLTGERLLAQDSAAAGASPARELYQPERVLITHGSQQLLYLVTECLCDPGDIVLVEDPTYFVYLGILQSHGVRCRGVSMETDGLDLRRLESRLAALKRRGELGRVRLLYLVSYYQNPTGVTTHFAKKTAVLDLLRYYGRAAGHTIFLLEDAAYRELRFGGPDVPSALAVGPHAQRVIYAGTYSKPFATGVRVGFGLLPDLVRRAVERVKGNHDFGTASLLQHLLARALATGAYDRHLVELRRRYAGKAEWMAQALRRHFPPEVCWREPRGGLYIWAALPRSLPSGPDSLLLERALAADVLYVPGRLCYAPDPTRRAPNQEMRLSFGNAGEQDIRTGIRRLGEVIRTLLTRVRRGIRPAGRPH